MIPQKPNKLYIELSETLNHSSFLIEEVVEFYYKTVKNLLADLYAKRERSKIVFQIYKKNSIAIGIYNGDLKINYLNNY